MGVGEEPPCFSVVLLAGVGAAGCWLLGELVRWLVVVDFGEVVGDIVVAEDVGLPILLVEAASEDVESNAAVLGGWVLGLLVGELVGELVVVVEVVSCLSSGLAVVVFPTLSELTSREKQKSQDKLWARGTSFGFHPKQVFAEKKTLNRNHESSTQGLSHAL